MTAAPGGVWVVDGAGWTFHHPDAASVAVEGSGALALLDTVGRPVGYYARGGWSYAGEQPPPQRSSTTPMPPKVVA